MNMRQQTGPVYLEIYRNLKQELRTGEKKPGDELPSENTLAAQYSTTRTTVRKSLQLLEKEGLIHSWAGKGYFVSEPAHNRFSLDFPEDENQRPDAYKRIRVIKADSELQRIFNILPGSRVIEICRNIEDNGQCTAYDVKYLPYTRGKPMIEQEINYFVPFPDIVSLLVPTFLFYTRLELSAQFPPADAASVLGCSVDEPVLVLCRYFMDQNDRCIGYGRRYQSQHGGKGKLLAFSGYPEHRP